MLKQFLQDIGITFHIYLSTLGFVYLSGPPEGHLSWQYLERIYRAMGNHRSFPSEGRKYISRFLRKTKTRKRDEEHSVMGITINEGLNTKEWSFASRSQKLELSTSALQGSN